MKVTDDSSCANRLSSSSFSFPDDRGLNCLSETISDEDTSIHIDQMLMQTQNICSKKRPYEFSITIYDFVIIYSSISYFSKITVTLKRNPNNLNICIFLFVSVFILVYLFIRRPHNILFLLGLYFFRSPYTFS